MKSWLLERREQNIKILNNNNIDNDILINDIDNNIQINDNSNNTIIYTSKRQEAKTARLLAKQ